MLAQTRLSSAWKGSVMRVRWLAAVCCIVAVGAVCEATQDSQEASNGKQVALCDLDISKTQQGWGSPRKDVSVEGNPLQIAGQMFARGLGTHADSALYVQLNGGSRRFTAMVGVDDEVGRPGSVEFRILGDGKELLKSGMIRRGEAARKVDVDVSGIMLLVLIVNSGPDGINYDHADWAEAAFEVVGPEPRTIDGPREEAVILTPKPSPKPRINGARVFGVRPGSPVLYTIAATGQRPMQFAAEGLPAGLSLNATTGRITGRLQQRGEYRITLTASNSRGKTSRSLRLVVGDTIALTPPMGWNSWNCFASAVTAEKVRAAADAMVSSGLIDHGWTYINIDDYWQVKPGATNDPTLQGPQRDEQGRIVPNPRFPDMKELADYVHARGLKIGLYSSPGPLTCGGCIGSYRHEEQDAQRYGEWGFDYLKYDWCSYGQIAPRNPSRADLMKPYAVMQAALSKVRRDIVYSLCQYGMGDVSQWGATVGGNCWRTTGDITDTWGSMSSIGFGQADLAQYAGPGHWNDPDMLVVGKVGWGPNLRDSHLTPNEQYTHISLWCLLCSPLLIGCDMTQLDDFTLNLLTNDEVLEVNQDPLGQQARRVAQHGSAEVWAKKMEGGSTVAGLFNRDEVESDVIAEWSDLGLSGTMKARDLWRQKDVGVFTDGYTATVPRHGVVLIRLTPTAR
jgi:alpha-galactosidase